MCIKVHFESVMEYAITLSLSGQLLQLFDKSIDKETFVRVHTTKLKRNPTDKFLRYELI